jgi:hypothetical protein
VICSSRKPVPTPRKRGGALRYAWLRAPPLREVDAQTRQKKGALDKRPHMKVVSRGSLKWGGLGNAIPSLEQVRPLA